MTLNTKLKPRKFVIPRLTPQAAKVVAIMEVAKSISGVEAHSHRIRSLSRRITEIEDRIADANLPFYISRSDHKDAEGQKYRRYTIKSKAKDKR